MDFSINGKFYHYMSKIADLIILSMLWLAASLPLITVGASSAAMYYCVVKSIRQDHTSVVKDYFRTFRSNFKQCAIVSVLVVVFSILCTLVGTSVYAVAKQGNVLTWIYTIYLVLLGLGLSWLHYVIAYIARFSAPMGTILKNSLVICLTNLPASLSMLAMFIIVFGFWALYLPRSALIILILPALYALISSFLIERIFSKYLPEKSTDNEHNTGGKIS